MAPAHMAALDAFFRVSGRGLGMTIQRETRSRAVAPQTRLDEWRARKSNAFSFTFQVFEFEIK
jgi:hypothetical protein